MKAVVTGGSGFIGSRVVRLLLAAGHEVRIFSRRKDAAALFGAKVESASGDLEDVPSLISAMDGMEVLYHIGEIKNTSGNSLPG
ncbi:MAG: NAD(P)H-binding protein [Nitrospiraceae bacterium]|nr:NAD(P)H-binding protein [Nitrospiraceae bacterium]MDA8091050.1 NAD(P)H-binding protein [Nitrospiraceae bacterium]